MATPTEIRVSYGVTKKTKIQYEFLRLDESITLSLEEGESVTETINKTRAFLQTKVNADADAIINGG